MKRIIILISVITISLYSFAQNPNGWNQNQQRREFSPELYMKTQREFVAREAHLTEAEQTRFFPLLNEMLDKQHKLMWERRNLMMKGWTPNLSESDYESMVTKLTYLEVESQKIEQNYYKKFHTVLSWKKIYAVRIALSRFQMEALNRFQPGPRNNNTNNSNNKPQQQQPQRGNNSNWNRNNGNWNRK